MTKSIKLFFVSFCLVISLSAVHAVDYYFLYDPSCMDLLEYRYQETSAGNEFLAYGLSVSESERLILQTGSRANVREISLADPLITGCQNGQSLKNGNLAKKINDNQANVYVAIPTDTEGRFQVRRVNQADYLSTSGNQLVLGTSLYRLTYNTNSNQFEGDLSNTDPRGKVYFQNQQQQGSCTTFEFLQRYDYNPQAGLLIRVNPKVGILSETNRGGASTFYSLSSINGQPVEQVLAQRCGDQGMASQESGPSSYGDDNFIARGAQQASLRTSNNAPQTHQVARGETLYQISQKYQVSVENLKRWNNKNDNLLKVNENLIVSAPANAYQNNDYREDGQRPSSYGDENFVIKGTGPSSIAAGTVHGGSDGPYATNPYNAAWLNTNGQHVVQAEETVASIARMYGYTEERFRLFNNLGENEAIRPGQVLQTLNCVEPNQMRSRGNNPTGYQYDPSNQGYSNQANDPYYDPNATFEPYADYPSEFQARNQQDMSNNAGMRSKGAPGPSSYGMPMNSQGTNVPSTPQQSAMDYYGPVPGSFNENRPLQEFGNEPRSNANPAFTAKGGTTAGPSSYGAVPQTRSNSGTNTSGRYTDQSQELYQRSNSLPASNRQTYTVQNGDTVRSIAQKLGIAEQRLRDLNKLEKNEIVLPDQKIYIN